MQVSKQGHLLLFQEADVALHALNLMLQGHGIHGNPGLGPTWVEDKVIPTSSEAICLVPPQIPCDIRHAGSSCLQGEDSSTLSALYYLSPRLSEHVLRETVIPI